MMEAAEAGDRGAMVYIGRAFETGDGLGTLRYYCTIIIIRGGVGGLYPYFFKTVFCP